MSNHPAIICLMGPTAAGKTQLALDLSRQFPMEIISVDSAMVYRGMDIGTAKPDANLLHEIPHHLIDIKDPAESYSAAQFCDDALFWIKDIIARRKIPLLVGGTMLYFRALQQGLAPMPSANHTLRDRLTREGQELGWEVLHQRLQTVDPLAAHWIHPHDTQRIQRALEVYELTGKNITTWQAEHDNALRDYTVYNIAVSPHDRALLHQRIAERFTQMLNQGLIEEVQRLFNRGDLSLNTPAIRSVGYRQVWQYLLGELSYTEMQDKAIIATRQLAKRQLTWLRSWPNVMWFESESPHLLDQVIKELNNKGWVV